MCPRCGEFEIPGGNASFKASLRPLLSIFTRTRSAHGERVILTQSNVDAIVSEMQAIPVNTKTTAILAHMKKRSSFMGSWVPIDLDLDWPLFYTKSRDELLFILEHLRKDNLIEPEQYPYATHINCRLSMLGWENEYQGKATANRRAADLDAVTKIPSRKQYDIDLPEIISASKKQTIPLALLVIDLDHFKKINELAGHGGADQVLHDVAQKIQGILQGKGTTYRYGGDEMVAVLPNFILDEAQTVSERLRKEVERLQHLPPKVKSTVTIGIATYPVPVSNPEDLFDVADRKLLDIKKSGRRNMSVAAGATEIEAKTTEETIAKTHQTNKSSPSWQLILTLNPAKKCRYLSINYWSI